MDQKLKGEKAKETVELSDASRNILVTESGFICCLRSGKMENFSLKGGKIDKYIDKIDEEISQCLTPSEVGSLCFNKAVGKYFFTAKGRTSVTVFQINS